jgi:prepilin-type N-terminal cleavage/methylation domain-containing protein
MLRKQTQTGFTIVELLIVIVVIAILAAITIVSYNGIQQRATNTVMQSELSQLVRKVESYKITDSSETYPVDLATAGIPLSKSGALSYFYSVASNSFCAQIVKGTTSYVATSTVKNTTVGICTESGLLAWWKLNGNANDSSANSNNGTMSNTTSTNGENGVSANALAFTSASLSMVSVPDSTSLNDTPQTFSFWTKPADWSSPTASTFMAKRNGATSGFFIAYINNQPGISFDCGGTPQRWNTGYAPPVIQWTHIVLTCSMNGNVVLFANGVFIGSRTGIDRSAMNNTAVGLRLGQDSQGSGNYILNGALDDVRIYNRTLSYAEVQLLYNAHAQ